PVPLGLVVDAHLVAVGIGEDVDRAVAGVAVLPALAQARGLDRGDPALERLRRAGPEVGPPDTGPRGGGELDRGVLVVVPRAQEDRVPRRAVLREAEVAHEEVEALLG